MAERSPSRVHDAAEKLSAEISFPARPRSRFDAVTDITSVNERPLGRKGDRYFAA
jgi:hypothetical protein